MDSVLVGPAPDDELWARQAALQARGDRDPRRPGPGRDAVRLGPMLLTGSYVSGLMCWPDLDVMVFTGAEFFPHDVLYLLHRILDRPAVVGFDYRDERGPRSPTGAIRDERYHVVIQVARDSRTWRIDLTLWLNDPHANVTAWHESLRDTVTADQRAAILRIKDVWSQLPGYPDHVDGMQIYQAVLDDGVRTPQQFTSWLATHGYAET